MWYDTDDNHSSVASLETKSTIHNWHGYADINGTITPKSVARFDPKYPYGNNEEESDTYNAEIPLSFITEMETNQTPSTIPIIIG